MNQAFVLSYSSQRHGTGTAADDFLSVSPAILWSRRERLPEGAVVAVPKTHFADTMASDKPVRLAGHIILNRFKLSEFSRRRSLEQAFRSLHSPRLKRINNCPGIAIESYLRVGGG